MSATSIATHASAQGLAAQVGARVDDQLGTIEGLLLAVAEAASADSASVAAQRPDAASSARWSLPPYVTNLALWSNDGRNIGSSDPDPSRARKMEVAAHRFFREALGSNQADGRPADRESRDRRLEPNDGSAHPAGRLRPPASHR